jgi:hypothetical protein
LCGEHLQELYTTVHVCIQSTLELLDHMDIEVTSFFNYLYWNSLINKFRIFKYTRITKFYTVQLRTYTVSF